MKVAHKGNNTPIKPIPTGFYATIGIKAYEGGQIKINSQGNLSTEIVINVLEMYIKDLKSALSEIKAEKEIEPNEN